MLKRLSLMLAICAQSAYADQTLVNQSLDEHILPKFDVLAEKTAILKEVAALHCAPKKAELQSVYSDAFDAWIRASHIRVGPSEDEDRAFALSFWPDTKGFTNKALNALVREADPIVYNPEAFATLSIATRGFYAMEFLLYDPALHTDETAEYRCDLVRAIASEIHRNALAIKWGWQSYQDPLRMPKPDGIYKNEEEALQEVFKALNSGLQFTSQARLGRPLGTFEHPRPRRAEARRSARSARHVELSLRSTYELAMILAQNEPKIAQDLVLAYDRAVELVGALNDPDFSNVADPTGRFRIEILQQAVDRIREIVTLELAPALGVTAGFNALDGD